MPITFSNIPQALRVPGVYNEIDNSLAGSSTEIKKILLLGQKLPAGTAPAGVPVQVFSASDARAKFGQGSMLALMAERFKTLNTTQELWALPLSDASSGIAASGEIVVTGTATSVGQVHVYINGVKVSIPVSVGQTAIDVAKALSDAISANAGLPVKASVNGSIKGQVDLAALNKGAAGNDIPLKQGVLGESQAPGITLTLTAMASGAGNPTIDYSALGDVHYHYFVTPYTDTASLTALGNELNSRYLPLRQLGARAFLAKRGSLSEIEAFGQSLNNPHLTCLGVGDSVQSALDWAVTNCAQVAPQLANDPSAPLSEIALSGLIPPKPFTWEERNGLLFSGIATWTLSSDAQAYLERQVTTYQKTPTGDADSSYLDIQVPETLDAIRNLRNAEIKKRFKGYKLAKTGTFGPGTKVMTPSILRTFLLSFYQGELMQTRAWVEDYDHYKATLLIEVDSQDKNRLSFKDEPTLVGQFLVASGLTRFQ